MKIVFFGSKKFFHFYKGALESAGHEIIDLEGAPDLGVIAYYGKIIKPEILKIPKYGFINIHPSLLPRYRGPSPVRSAILAGDTLTGVTIHITISKVDAGEILAQKEAPINPEDNYEKLEEKLFKMGAEILPETIDGWISGIITPQKQDESKATYTKIIKTEDGHIDWKKTPEEILCQIKALSPDPGTFTFWGGKRLLILEVKIEKISHNYKFGEIVKSENGFKITARNGFILPLRVKLEGHKELNAEAFLHGQRNFVGKILN